MALPVLATTYERHEDRMNDHFAHAEWQEVRQEADAMIKMRPNSVEPYAAGLIAAQFMEDFKATNMYLKNSQANRVHIDSLLNCVYVRTKRLHNAPIYEQLLLNLKANNKGFTRVFNLYLLEFYAFARKTHETIAIADELLQVTPDNIRFKKIKAIALFAQGDSQEAVKLYETVLAKDSTDYDVLTFLGAYYAVQDSKDLSRIDSLYTSTQLPIDSLFAARKQDIIDNRIPRTLDLLQRAYNIRPSDYLRNELEKLSKLDSKLPTHPSKKKKKQAQRTT